MLIHFSDPQCADDLCAHFLRSGFTAEPAGPNTVAVTRPGAPTADAERRDIEIHLRVYQVANPGAGAALA